MKKLKIIFILIIISILISFIPVYLNLIQIYYIPLLILTDLILLYSIFVLSTNYSKSESLKVKKYILYAMLFGLITFLMNSMIVW